MANPVDSAFSSSRLMLPQAPAAETLGQSYECLSFLLLLAVSLLCLVALMKKVLNIFPFLMANFIRWKECLNLEASAKLSRDRNMVALASCIPFCLVVYVNHLYSPAFLEALGNNTRLWCIIGIFGLFVSIRSLLEHILKPRRIPFKTYTCITRLAYSFFITLLMLLLILNGICAVTGISPEHTRSAMLWLSAFIYFLYLIRKLQIFASCFSVFAGFLYLCALEILPTGALIASAVIF